MADGDFRAGIRGARNGGVFRVSEAVEETMDDDPLHGFRDINRVLRMIEAWESCTADALQQFGGVPPRSVAKEGRAGQRQVPVDLQKKDG